MKFRLTCALVCAALSLASASLSVPAQSTVWPPPSQPASTPAEQSAQPQAATPAQAPAAPQPRATAPDAQPVPQGKVLFSRSIDENGETVTHADSAAASPGEPTAPPTATDTERQAITFTDLDLDVHLHSADSRIAVRAQLTIRNDGKVALDRIPLQISSSLHWERLRLNGSDAKYVVSTLNSDTDHTGQLHEAAIALAAPLAPGSTAHLDVDYSGAIALDAHRLLAIGTPDEAALHSDWDRVGADFTGLRGFGNVVWYPVSSVPVILGDGARVFDEIGRHKLSLSGAHFRLRLADEFPANQAPTVALVNGQSVALTIVPGSAGADIAGTATAQTSVTTLGFASPSIFVAIRTPHSAPDVDLLLQPEDDSAAAAGTPAVNSPAVTAWTAASSSIAPFVENWLGRHPQAKLTVLELPDTQDAPFETGALLAVPVRAAPADQLQAMLVHAMAHAYLHDSAQSRPAWLDEGVASFLGTLWIEKQQDREKALESLEASRPALALAEPESPGESTGHPLARAISPVYYRTKAEYVLWMLRDIAGSEALSAALRAYGEPAVSSSAPAASTTPSSDPPALPSFEKLIEESGPHNDLGWFFADWVDADHGLPDLSIESVFPKSESADSWLVTVNIANSGYAAAEVPVSVRSGKKIVTQRVRVPARGKVPERILIQGKPDEVQLNDGAVPETQASVHITRLGDADGSSAPAGLAGPSQ